MTINELYNILQSYIDNGRGNDPVWISGEYAEIVEEAFDNGDGIQLG